MITMFILLRPGKVWGLHLQFHCNLHVNNFCVYLHDIQLFISVTSKVWNLNHIPIWGMPIASSVGNRTVIYSSVTARLKKSWETHWFWVSGCKNCSQKSCSINIGFIISPSYLIFSSLCLITFLSTSCCHVPDNSFFNGSSSPFRDQASYSVQ
jgi:hypothetical protein